MWHTFEIAELFSSLRHMGISVWYLRYQDVERVLQPVKHHREHQETTYGPLGVVPHQSIGACSRNSFVALQNLMNNPQTDAARMESVI